MIERCRKTSGAEFTITVNYNKTDCVRSYMELKILSIVHATEFTRFTRDQDIQLLT